MDRHPDLPDGSSPGALSGAPLETPPPASSEARLETPDAERYARRQVLGAGGMGRVVLARDLRLDRDVALKEVSPQAVPAHAAALEARLAREAAVTARLEHPGIVPVYDAGRNPDGTAFYTMRVIRGRSLEDAVREAKDLEARMRFLRHVLDASQAVAWAHRHGIVHRDLKPANIMVGEFGETQVVDWGLARPVAGSDDPHLGVASDDAALTVAGAAVGTPHYMSPEQAMGQPADQRSDVWCLGFVLYEVLAGRRARATLSATDALAEARLALPALDLEGLPPALAAIIRRATARRPADRYTDAKALADDLAAYLDGRRVTAHAYTTWELFARIVRAWRVPITVALVALVAIAVALGFGFAQTAAERDRANTQRAAAEAARTRATEAEVATREALQRAESDLGRALVGSALSKLEHHALPEAELTAASALTHAESPEARGLLAMLRGGDRPRRVAVAPLPGPCDGVALASDLSVGVCDVGVELRGFDPRTGDVLWRHAQPRSESGWMSGLALVEAEHRALVVNAHGDGFLWIDLASGDVVGDDADCCIRYRPSNDGLLTFSVGHGFFRSRDATDRPPRHWPVPCGTPVSSGAAEVGRDGRQRFVYGCGDGTLVVGGDVPDRQISLDADAPPHLAYGASFVPDREQVVIGSNKGQAALVDLATGRTLRVLEGLRGVIAEVGVSPDGGVAAIADEERGVFLWDLATGAGLGRLPANLDAGFRFVTTAPRRLAAWSDHELVVWELARGRPQRLPVAGGITTFELSPDGARLAAAARQEAAVYAMADGRELFRHHADAIVKAVAFLPGDELAVGVAASEPLHLLAIGPGEAALPVREVGRHATTRRLVRGASGLVVRGLDYATSEGFGPGGGVAPLLEREDAVLDLAVTPDRATALILASKSRVYRVGLLGEAPVVAAIELTTTCDAVATSPDGERMACANGGTVELLDRDGQLEAVLTGPAKSGLGELAWSQDGRFVGGGTRDGQALVWEVATGKLTLRVTAHEERVSALLFLADGRSLLAGSWDDTVSTLDLSVIDAAPDELLAEAEATWGLSRASVTAE